MEPFLFDFVLGQTETNIRALAVSSADCLPRKANCIQLESFKARTQNLFSCYFISVPINLCRNAISGCAGEGGKSSISHLIFAQITTLRLRTQWWIQTKRQMNRSL